MATKRAPKGYRIEQWDDGAYHIYGPGGFVNDDALTRREALKIAYDHRDTNRPMTLAQARAKARERWGWGKIENSHRELCFKRSGVCKVGYHEIVRRGLHFVTCIPVYCGQGPTFEAAFADADRREAEAKEKMSNG